MATKEEKDLAKLVELRKACDEKSIQYTEEATAKDLAKLLKENTKGEKAGASSAVNSEVVEGDKEYIWLKFKAYVSETERLVAGFYVIPAGAFPRLRKIKSTECEVFTEVSRNKLYDIAKWAGFNLDNFDGDDEELLSALATEPKPYL